MARTSRINLGVGGLFAAGGLYFVLVGARVLPPPGGGDGLNAPLWVVGAVGLVFLPAGLAVIIQAVAGADRDGNLPATAPRWLQAAQFVAITLVMAAFGAIGTWIALFGKEEAFSGAPAFAGARLGLLIVRGAFGFGALVCWLGAVGVAVSGWRRLTAGKATE